MQKAALDAGRPCRGGAQGCRTRVPPPAEREADEGMLHLGGGLSLEPVLEAGGFVEHLHGSLGAAEPARRHPGDVRGHGGPAALGIKAGHGAGGGAGLVGIGGAPLARGSQEVHHVLDQAGMLGGEGFGGGHGAAGELGPLAVRGGWRSSRRMRPRPFCTAGRGWGTGAEKASTWWLAGEAWTLPRALEVDALDLGLGALNRPGWLSAANRPGCGLDGGGEQIKSSGLVAAKERCNRPARILREVDPSPEETACREGQDKGRLVLQGRWQSLPVGMPET